MALATTCPQCKTSFRVVPDQLKLRRGLVRCGVCQHVFSGVDSLRYVEDPPGQSAIPAPAPVPAAVQPSIEPEPIEPEPIEPEPIEPEPIEPEPIEPGRDAELPGPVPAAGFEPDPLPSQAREAVRSPRLAPFAPLAPHDGADIGREADEADAVDFFADERSARGFTSRGAAFASVASVALAALLLLQLTIGARDWLGSRMPWLTPTLSTMLAPLGLQVTPPQEIGALTIESFELQPASAQGLYAVGALLRNRTGNLVQWPALELSLLDERDEVVVRRVLRPADYLPDAAEAMRRGVAPRAELPLRTAIEVSEAAPTGYRVRLVAP